MKSRSLNPLRTPRREVEVCFSTGFFREKKSAKRRVARGLMVFPTPFGTRRTVVIPSHRQFEPIWPAVGNGCQD